jgi:hypothetical protein
VEGHAVHLDTNSAFALGPKKTTEILDRVGQSQDLRMRTDATAYLCVALCANFTALFRVRLRSFGLSISSSARLWPGPSGMSLQFWLPVMKSSVFLMFVPPGERGGG